MRHLPRLFANNRAWATSKTKKDPKFFSDLCAIQTPRHLWIGCADSRVPANEIVGLAPGELFVHRNVANVVRQDDFNCLSVLQYAIDYLKVTDVIVCGHYGCGGVQAAFGNPMPEPLESWIKPIRQIKENNAKELARQPTDEEKLRRLCELNVIQQVKELCQLNTLTKAWEDHRQVVVHGWIYDLHDGLLRDLDVSYAGQ